MHSVAVGDIAGHRLPIHFESESVAENGSTLYGECYFLEVLHLELAGFAGSHTLEEGAITGLRVFRHRDEAAGMCFVVQVACKEHTLAHNTAKGTWLQVCKQEYLAILEFFCLVAVLESAANSA